MRQHCKESNASGKHKRRERWSKGLEILAKMKKPSPFTKSIRRKMFAEARKQAFKKV